MGKMYISGKITGLDYQEAFNSFELAEKEFLIKGWEVINPMKLKHQHDESWQNYMREDLKALLDCGCVYMLNNWEDSVGARIEHKLAMDLEILIIYQ